MSLLPELQKEVMKYTSRSNYEAMKALFEEIETFIIDCVSDEPKDASKYNEFFKKYNLSTRIIVEEKQNKSKESKEEEEEEEEEEEDESKEESEELITTAKFVWPETEIIPDEIFVDFLNFLIKHHEDEISSTTINRVLKNSENPYRVIPIELMKKKKGKKIYEDSHEIHKIKQ